MSMAALARRWLHIAPPARSHTPLWPNDSALSFGCADAMVDTKSRSSSQATCRADKMYPDHPGVRQAARCEGRQAGSALAPSLRRFPTPPPCYVRQSFYSALSDMQGNLGFAPAQQLTVY